MEPELLSEAYYLKGNLYNKNRNTDSASYYFQQSLDLTNESNDSLTALIYKSLGNANLAKRQYDEALDLYKKSLKIEESRKTKSENTIAGLYQNIGIVHASIGSYDTARYYFQKSINLKEKVISPDDPALGRGYLNFGRFLQIMGDLYASIEYFDKAENLFISKLGEDYFGLASVYYNKGGVYIQLNDFQKALSYQERALDLYKINVNPDNSIFREIYMNIGMIYSGLNQYKEAVEYFLLSLQDGSKSESRVRALRNLGSCYFELDSLDKAEKYLLLSIAETKDLFGREHSLSAYAYYEYGVFCDKIGKFDTAEKMLYKAFEIFVENFGHQNRDVSNTLSQLGTHYFRNDDINKSLEYFQRALVSYNESFNDTNIYSNPLVENFKPDVVLLNSLVQKSIALYYRFVEDSNDLNDLKAALNTGLTAIDWLEKTHLSYEQENSKLTILTKFNEIYDLGVIVASELYKLTGDQKYISVGFEISEKGKAVVLLATVRELEAMELASIPEEIRTREKNLKRELSYFNNLIYEETLKSNPDANKLAIWKKWVFEKEKSYDSLMIFFESHYPEFYNLKFNTSTIKISDIQTNLSEDECLLEYKVADSLLVSFLITNDSASMSFIKIDSTFYFEVESLIKTVNSFPKTDNASKDYKKFVKLSNKIHNLLLGNVNIPKQCSKLIIIPDDILGYLNFDVLITTCPDTTSIDYKNLDYLLNDYAISYGYSGTLLFKHLRHRSSTRKVLAMAPTYQHFENGMVDNHNPNREISDYLQPLKYTSTEVNNINDIFKGLILTGHDATETRFKAVARNFNILHFAMHTIINDEDPLTSKLVFSLTGDSLDDGFLNTYEIYDLELNADLAVLSACKTGAGNLRKGEGIMSLARGFLYAGVPSIVMTLWEVEDISGAEIITSFYHNLRNKDKKDIALQKAKLNYLSNANQLQSHPYFWAAYMQIGNTQSVVAYSCNYMLLAISLLVVVVIGLFLFRKKLKRIH
ncbi:MAG: CHAT domain-containing protein [Bacteroidales bacterium]|nr:CHAT domain-containing protein [Bacteroidales bacterium]